MNTEKPKDAQLRDADMTTLELARATKKIIEDRTDPDAWMVRIFSANEPREVRAVLDAKPTLLIKPNSDFTMQVAHATATHVYVATVPLHNVAADVRVEKDYMCKTAREWADELMVQLKEEAKADQG